MTTDYQSIITGAKVQREIINQTNDRGDLLCMFEGNLERMRALRRELEERHIKHSLNTPDAPVFRALASNNLLIRERLARIDPMNTPEWVAQYNSMTPEEVEHYIVELTNTRMEQAARANAKIGLTW